MSGEGEQPGQFAPGARVGNIEIERSIGRGGVGEVYLGRDVQIGRQVALKVLSPRGRAASMRDREQFLREAQVVGRLNSPHVVTLFQLHDLGEDRFALEMEHVEGGSVADLLETGSRPSLERVVDILRGVLRGLAAAHENDVLHRDVKPGNVLLGTDGSVKLADFGLARVLNDETLTRPSLGVVGTPSYIPPEVLLGEDPTEAGDLWAVGILAFELLTGKLPFPARDLPELFASVQNASPAPLGDEVPPALAEAVMRCLAKRPVDRPSSARQLLEELTVTATQRAAAVRESAVLDPTVPEVVGRAAARERIDELLARASAGEPAAMLVTGAAGIGKTALLGDTRRRARRAGRVWLDARVTASEGPLASLLRAGRQELTTGDRIAAVTDTIAAGDFGPAAEALRKLLKGEAAPSLESREQIVWAIEHLLQGLSRDETVCVAVQSAQDADTGDVALLQDLARRLPPARVAFLIEVTTTPERGVGAFVEWRGIERLDVPPLDELSLFAVLQKAASPRDLAGAVVERVVRQCGGNPLLALELLHHLETSGALVERNHRLEPGPGWDDTPLPAQLRELAEARLAGLDHESRSLLEVAAVDGAEFDGRALAAALELSLLAVLRQLQRLYIPGALIVPDSDGYRFASVLLQEVIYEQTAPELRREVHRRLAEHLETRTDPVDPERLARHWEGAGMQARAVPHLARATQRAAERVEVRRMRQLAERAGFLAGGLPVAVVQEHTELLVRVISCLNDVGDLAPLARLVSDLRRVAEETGDPVLGLIVAIQTTRDAYLRGLGSVDCDPLTAAIDMVPEGRAELHVARAHFILGLVAKQQEDTASARAAFERADRRLLVLGDPLRHAGVVDQLGQLARREGDYEEAERRFAEAAELALQVGCRQNAAISDQNRALLQKRRRRYDGLLATLERANRTVVLTGSRAAAAIGNKSLADVHLALGDLERARVLSRSAFRELEEAGRIAHAADALAMVVEIEAALGAMSAASEALDILSALVLRAELSSARTTHAAVSTRMALLLAQDDLAVQMMGRAVELVEPNGVELAWLMLGAAEFVLFGLPPASVVDLEIAGARPGVNADPLVSEAAAILRGAVAARESEGDPARIEHAAATLHDPALGVGSVLDQAYARLLEAIAARRRGRPRDAERLALAAASTAAGIGHRWAEVLALRLAAAVAPGGDHRRRSDQLVRRIGESIGESSDVPSDVLSERERVVRRWTATPRG